MLIIKKCSWCGKEVKRKPSAAKLYKKFFCNREHMELWFKTKEGREYQSRKGAMAMNSPEKRKLSGKRSKEVYFKNVKEGKLNVFKGFAHIDITKQHSCALEGCDRQVFSVWSYCKKHMDDSLEGRIKHRARFLLRRAIGHKSIKGMPKDIVLAMVAYCQIKEDLRGYPKTRRRNNIARIARSHKISS